VDSHRFRPASLINNAARFAKQRFVEEMKQFIETKLEAFRGGQNHD
jgi:hypothetical protein